MSTSRPTPPHIAGPGTDAVIIVLDGGLACGPLAAIRIESVDGSNGYCPMACAFVLGERSEVAPIVVRGRAAPNYDRASALRLHQYYTRHDVANRLRDVFRKHCDPARYLMVEPSAGAGSFFRLLPAGSLGFGVDPRYPGIRRADFLKVRLPRSRPIACLGNPPFGRNANLAIAFFNYAAARSHLIGFILPRTARKGSFQNKLNRDFHLAHQEVVPEDAFLFCGSPYNVPAVFQIWERRAYTRDLWPVETEHPDFKFLKDRVGADFAIRRVGARAGVVLDDLTGSPSSHHFVQVLVRDVEAIMRALEPDFRAVAGNVAGNPSLAKSEIFSLYKARLKTLGGG